MCDLVLASELVEGEQSTGVWRARHVKAMVDAVTMGEDRASLHTSDLLKWHADLFPCGGVWRASNVMLKGMEHCPPPAEMLPIEVKQFCDNVSWWLMFSSEPPLQRLAYLHLQFGRLHPFTDGNGRVGRLVLNYCAAYLRQALIRIDPAHRAAYIDALARGDARALAGVFCDCVLEGE